MRDKAGGERQGHNEEEIERLRCEKERENDTERLQDKVYVMDRLESESETDDSERMIEDGHSAGTADTGDDSGDWDQ